MELQKEHLGRQEELGVASDLLEALYSSDPKKTDAFGDALAMRCQGFLMDGLSKVLGFQSPAEFLWVSSKLQAPAEFRSPFFLSWPLSYAHGLGLFAFRVAQLLPASGSWP